MAFYKDTLTKMQAAIKVKDWDKVKEVLRQHNYLLSSKERDVIEHDLADAAFYIKKYDDALLQVSKMLKSVLKGEKGTVISLMEMKTKEAIEAAETFEKTLKHLIKKKKFME